MDSESRITVACSRRRSKWLLRIVLLGALAATILTACSGGEATSERSGTAGIDKGACSRDAQRGDVVPCDGPHEWEAVGENSFEALAAFTPYLGGIEGGIWDATYLEGCTALATAATSETQDLSTGTSIIGGPIGVPTLEQWTNGDRTVTCGAAVEISQDKDELRSVPVNPMTGTGSLIEGTWRELP